MTLDCNEYAELVADDVDERLSPAVRRAAEAHVSRCPRCAEMRRRQALARSIVRRRAARHTTPEPLRRTIAAAVATPSRSWPVRRLLVAAVAAGLLLALVSLFRAGAPGILEVMAEDAVAADAQSLPLALHTRDIGELKRYYRESGQIHFERSADDFRAVGLEVVGGRIGEVGGVHTTVTLYQGALGRVVCRRFRFGEIPLPEGGETVGPARLFSVDRVTVAIIRLGDVVCCLATTMPRAVFARYLLVSGVHPH
jgi:hypothetical protein